ncbi:hypothetical protein [Marinibacterium sp. SX1]|uniref:hypothetical protein n=1 Tax=Marinibacterium sp. SX1 TaxID=3388424 RepID=UPI003D16EBD4
MSGQQNTQRQPEPQPVDQVDVTVIRDDADLRINHFQGDSDVAVVAFTGIGHGMGAIQQDEFVGTAIGAERNHVISVIDRDRSWYSAPDIQKRILSTLLDLKARLGVARMVCLGNSMGGYGALLFAERLGADTAIAFVPQYTMRLDFGERRWGEFRPAMHEDNLDTLGPHLTGRTRAFAVFGAEDLRDRMHVTRIRDNCIARVHLVAGSDHNNLTVFLKRQGVLAPLIAAMIAGDHGQVARLLAPFSVNPGQGPT